MQRELLTENPSTKIRRLGLNEAGYEAEVPTAVLNRSIPYLQDTPEQNVWAAWAVTYRDVVILDVENVHVDTYNLSSNDLADPVNYEELKLRLKAAAGEL
jgi:hypothetical protein